MNEKEDRIRVLIPEIEEGKMMEVSALIIEAESSLIDRLCHEIHSEYRYIHRNL